MKTYDRRRYVHVHNWVIAAIAVAVFLGTFFAIGMVKETYFPVIPVKYDYNNADYKPIGNGMAEIWMRRTVKVEGGPVNLFVSRLLVSTMGDEQIVLPSNEEVVIDGANNVNRVFFLPELDPGEWCFVITTRWKPALSLTYHMVELPKTCFTVPEKTRE